MHPPSVPGKERSSRTHPHGRAGGEATEFNTAPLGKTMTASDNTEIQRKAKTGGGKQIQETTLTASEHSSDD